jgi:hypothetical protein
MSSDPMPTDPHPHLDSLQLRLIAEAASGLRGEPVHFVAQSDGTIREMYHGEGGGEAGGAQESGHVPPPLDFVVVPAFTENVAPNMPPLTVATLQAQGVPDPIDLLDLPGGLGPADAVFWSESAVEKFVIPYYASVYGNQAARAVGDILEAFHGDRGDGGGRGSKLTDPDVQTYAMAHIPKSEYVMLDDAGNVVADLAVIYKDESQPGGLNARRLPDFLRWWRERRQQG